MATERTRQPAERRSPGRRFWMQRVSFAGLHRLFLVLAERPEGLRPLEWSRLAVDAGLRPPRRPHHRRREYSATTLFHYRNTLLHLGAVRREGRVLRVREGDSLVDSLRDAHLAPGEAGGLGGAAREAYARLVLRNRDCAELLLGLFAAPETEGPPRWDSWGDGFPVRWHRDRAADGEPEAVFRNTETGATLRYDSCRGIRAVLYGLRYWATKELGLLDEYGEYGGFGTILFPVAPASAAAEDDSAQSVFEDLLRECSGVRGEWASFAVSDLVRRLCRDRRRPLRALDRAIARLTREWPGHTYLVATSPALATLTSPNRQADALKLRCYYKSPGGPYISHLRVHRAVTESRATRRPEPRSPLRSPVGR